MRLACRLRELRGGRSIKQAEHETGIHRGYLSRYERGMELPRDHHVPALEQFYGAPARRWYAPHVWIEITADEPGRVTVEAA